MPNDLFMWIIVLWSIFLAGTVGIGGFFMFRKFLKRMPKQDGKSILDWQEHYINETRHLWSEDQKEFLNELVEPVPELFRDIAKGTIAGKIGELALKENVDSMTDDIIIKGYISATPKRDHKFLVKKLKEKNIDIKQYESYFQKN
ncbi:DUF2621 domain-containing protein [Evansella cellulosilytica]|uniref:DUF2621 domain-containing protein n=1 Tax=Evansella cellulosilytica (strain ATCC 21833 / DSM 2522 / FERM P-1141 / JCM 9156 / N-4) TaxID=649639 RepID=E6TRY9_EVAC2|nr:DUF2621 domain-containing protein [Evansella cellulosilytica]ADU30643.1 hypothetical protein Bcell_2385 [Evansella cellulosilytica DSM 2522]